MTSRIYEPIKILLFKKVFIIGICFLALLIARGVLFSFPILFVALLEEFGWSREITSSIFSFNLFLSLGLGQFLMGLIQDRVGGKLLLVLGSVMLSISLFMMSRAKTVWEFYLYIGFLSSLGFAGLGWVPVVSILSKWFQNRRGFIFSLAFSGIGFGALIFGPLTQYLISNLGWRMAYIYLGVIVAIILPPLMLVQPSIPRKSVESEGKEAPLGKQGNGQYAKAKTLKQVLCTQSYWYLFLVYLFSAIAIFSIHIHQVVYLVDKGFGKMFVASILGVQGIMSTIGRIFFAHLSDIFNRTKVLIVSLILLSIGVGFLGLVSFIQAEWVIYLFTLFYGIPLGVTPPILSAIVADTYHGPNFGRIYGFLLLSDGISGAIGPWIAGYLFDRTGSYMSTFGLAICLIILACFILNGMNREFGVRTQPV